MDAADRERLEQLWAGRPATRNEIYGLLRHEIDKIVEGLIYKMGLPKTVDYEALVAAGHVGGLQAIEKFQPARNLSFNTFSQFRIRGEILDELRRSDIKRSVRRIVTERLTAEQELMESLGREPSQDEVCERLGWDAKQYLLSTRCGQASIDAVVGRKSDHKQQTLKDRIYIPQERDFESVFREITRGLNLQEQTILYLRYYCGTSMKLTGQALDLSESRVSQLHSQLMDKLKTSGSERFADAFRS